MTLSQVFFYVSKYIAFIFGNFVPISLHQIDSYLLKHGHYGFDSRNNNDQVESLRYIINQSVTFWFGSEFGLALKSRWYLDKEIEHDLIYCPYLIHLSFS